MLRVARFDQVQIQLNVCQIAETNRRNGQNRNGDGDPGGDSRTHWSMRLLRTRLRHQRLRQIYDFRPDAVGEDLAYQLQILVGQTTAAMFLKGCSQLIELFAGPLVDAAGLPGDGRKNAAKTNREALWDWRFFRQ